LSIYKYSEGGSGGGNLGNKKGLYSSITLGGSFVRRRQGAAGGEEEKGRTDVGTGEKGRGVMRGQSIATL